MGFFKLGRLERGKTESKADKKDGEPLLEGQYDGERKKREPEGTSMAARPAEGGRSAARVQAGLSVNDYISKTKSQQRQGLKPSGPELIAYARYLGIDPVADHDLLWIAHEALEAPLPSDWTEHFDSSDRVFYYNASTRHSSWTHPLEQVYRDTYKTIVGLRNSTMPPQDRADALAKLQAEVRQMDQDTHREVAKWSEHQDEQGHRFFFNKEAQYLDGSSTCEDAGPAVREPESGTPKTRESGMYLEVASLACDLGARNRMNTTGHTQGAADEIIDLSKDGLDDKNSPRTSEQSANASDSDSEDKKKKKKKKKKEKKKKTEKVLKEEKLAASSPDLMGARPPATSSAANLQMSNSEDGGGFGDGEALGKGHVKIKAGIRLEPLSALGGSSSERGLDVRLTGSRG
ncbi:unnamed protein product [Effrenium voratum]|nr:unnamed protein product [Effrenium voratum]